MAETAVQIEKDIEELSSLQKFDRFLKLVDFFHVERCGNNDCSNCMFVIDLRYLYIETTIAQLDSVDSLQKYSRDKYINFHSLRHFLRTLAEIEKKEYNLTLNFIKYWKNGTNRQHRMEIRILKHR